MRLGDFLNTATKQLHAAGVESARLDALILLEDVLGRDRANLIAHPEIALTEAQEALLNTYIARRCNHIPLTYIRGRAAFYGRDFTVNTHTLVPRPETEAMITLLKKLRLPAHPCIADIGTGSGCLGVTAALELLQSEVFLYDTSAAALKVASINARQLGVRAHIAEQDLLTHDAHHYDVILANLPYVPTTYPVNKAATHEPPVALFSGIDGLDHYRRFWQQVAISRPRYVITEALPDQHSSLEQLAYKANYTPSATEGLAQSFTLLGES